MTVNERLFFLVDEGLSILAARIRLAAARLYLAILHVCLWFLRGFYKLQGLDR